MGRGVKSAAGRVSRDIARVRRQCWTAIGRGGSFLAQSLADLLIEDRCVACGGEPRRETASLGEGGALQQPIHSRFWGAVQVTSRPICPACAAACVRARAPGHLGVRCAGGGVVRVGGDVFETGGEGAIADIPLLAPFMTGDVVLAVVHHFKFRGARAMAGLLAGAMAEAWWRWGARYGEAGLLVAVPMDAAARRRRGYNQASLLAHELSVRVGVPVVDGLTKVRRTRVQAQTPADARAANVRGAFRASPAVAGRDVWLVDDLVTSGATAGAAVAALMAAGARCTGVLCFARAL